jgi:hypothetical protein
MAFTYVTITHVYETAADIPAAGFIDFSPVKPMHNGLTVVQKTISAQLSGSGALSQLLAANTDPDTTPTGTTYEVTERITGQPKISYFIQVPHDQGPSLDIRSLAGWVGATTGGGGGGVVSVNGELPDGSGNIVVSASDIGAQPPTPTSQGSPPLPTAIRAARLAHGRCGPPRSSASTWRPRRPRSRSPPRPGSSPPMRRLAGPAQAHRHRRCHSGVADRRGQRAADHRRRGGVRRHAAGELPRRHHSVRVGPCRVGVRRRPAV